MEPVKVVVGYTNGKVVKGFTQDFLANKDRFHLHPAERALGEAREVLLNSFQYWFSIS